MSRAVAAAGSRRGLALGALAGLLLAALLQRGIEARPASRAELHPLLYLPSGKYLRVAVLGFNGLAADIFYLWSIQYYGNYEIADRYRYIEKIYGDVISELDPGYLDPYLIGSLIMNAEARDPQMALRLLDKGIARNPKAWILPVEAGFVCYESLQDYVRAARYFETALKAPDVNPLVHRLYAGMYDKAGDKRTSFREWSEIHDTAKDDFVRTVAWNHMHDLKVEIDLADLRDRLRAFEAAAGRPPRRLLELKERRLVESLPRDPEDREYDYNPATGAVTYRGGLILAR